MKKVQKKVSVLEAVFTAVVGFLTGVVLSVVKFFGTVVAVITWHDISEPVLAPKKPEAKKPEAKVATPVKKPKKQETKIVVKKLPRPVLKKRGKK